MNKFKYIFIIQIFFIKYEIAIWNELLQNWFIKISEHFSLIYKNIELKNDINYNKLIIILNNQWINIWKIIISELLQKI